MRRATIRASFGPVASTGLAACDNAYRWRQPADGYSRPRMATLNLKCAAAWRRFWGLRTDRYDVVAGGVIVGRIFLSPTAPGHRPWMWTSNEHKGRPPAFGYEPTRDQAMLAFARSWHRE
jgi:hypothetical protein